MQTILYSVFVLSCSLSQPDNCSKTYVGEIATPTPLGCLLGAQPFVRKWIVDHAGIRRFISVRCVDSRRREYELGRGQV